MKNIILLTLVLIATVSLGQNKTATSTNKDYTVPEKSMLLVDNHPDSPYYGNYKYHAYDNIYFGGNYSDLPRNGYTINDLYYKIRSGNSNNDDILYGIELTATRTIFDKKSTSGEINELKSTISKKYSQPLYINKTFIYHYNKNKGYDSHGPFSYQQGKEYDGKILQKQLYKWETDFKTIEIGYWLEYPQPKYVLDVGKAILDQDDYNKEVKHNEKLKNYGQGYRLYIKIVSKIITPYITPEIKKKENNDWDKF